MILHVGEDVSNFVNGGKYILSYKSITGKRKANEDSLLFGRSTDNKGSIFAIADGGSASGLTGKDASCIVVEKIIKWGSTIDFDHLDEKKYQGYVSATLDLVSDNIFDTMRLKLHDFENSTATCVAVGENTTLFANLGDARVYIMKDKRLVPLIRNSNNSYAQPKKFSGGFYSDLGTPVDSKLGCFVMPNYVYDDMLLITRGVYSKTSEENIEQIARSAPKEEIASRIIDSLNDPSNATAMVYSKRK